MSKKIINYQLSIINSRGYTLIELLAVMIILVAVGTIITTILISALRGGEKSLTTNEVRQSGNYAISQMSKMITYANSLEGVFDSTTSTWYNNCVPSPSGPSQSTQYSQVKITSSLDGQQTTFSCKWDGTNRTFVLASNSAYLTNPVITNTNARCYFTCIQSDSATPPTINFFMDLSTKTVNGFSFVEKQATIRFETSMTLRNNL